MTPQALQTSIANGEYTRHHSDITQLRYGVSRLRNPLLAGHAFHILPYQGLGTGIPRAAQAWENIALQDNPAANQFKATVQRDVASVDPSGGVSEGVKPNAIFTNDRFPRSRQKPEKYLLLLARNAAVSQSVAIGARAG